MERLVRKVVGDFRVSEEAVKRLNEVLESWVEDLVKLAASLAQHDGRRTIKVRDVEKALEMRKLAKEARFP